jgi:uncharacterized protein
MAQNLLDPVVLFFVLGVGAGVLRTGIKLPDAVYELLSIYLLLSIGLRGGVELSETNFNEIRLPAIGTLCLGVVIPLVAFVILRHFGKFNRANAAALAAHYGSVSAVTFAVVVTFVERLGMPHEKYVTVLLVLLEIPAIAVGISLAKLGSRMARRRLDYRKLAHEIFLGKSIYLLVGGLLIGMAVGSHHIQPVKLLFFDLFKGLLCLFLLEMGIITSRRFYELKQVGVFLVAFGVLMPVLSATLGIALGWSMGLSLGGTVILATLAASASYIAAPTAMRIAVPEANPTLYLTAALGITFPFNLLFGIDIYNALTHLFYDWLG